MGLPVHTKWVLTTQQHINEMRSVIKAEPGANTNTYKPPPDKKKFK